jgi:uncharacterized protein with von Willebrand factor type A (vWA) domain
VLSRVLRFGRSLRGMGVDVPHSRVLDAVQALEWVGVTRRDDVRATLRALLVHRHDDLERFDALFDEFFQRDVALAAADATPPPRLPSPSTAGVDLSTDDVASLTESAPGQAAAPYSAIAVSRSKDFADLTAAELEEARRLLSNLPWQLGTRRTRRWERAAGTAVDLRPALRQSLSRGELIELTYRRKRRAPRPIVVIGDVSGSMERYSRILLHFVRGLARNAGHVEAFVFSTTLTRISRRVAAAGHDRELSHIISDVEDWGGGTRIGDSLRLFNTRWARRVMRHGPVVLLVSDGWDRGDPAALSREIARLRRSCQRLIWLNPLLGSPGYEPLTRGMQAALPHLDDFLPAHNIDSLERLALHLGELG